MWGEQGRVRGFRGPGREEKKKGAQCMTRQKRKDKPFGWRRGLGKEGDQIPRLEESKQKKELRKGEEKNWEVLARTANLCLVIRDRRKVTSLMRKGGYGRCRPRKEEKRTRSGSEQPTKEKGIQEKSEGFCRASLCARGETKGGRSSHRRRIERICFHSYRVTFLIKKPGETRKPKYINPPGPRLFSTV